MILRFFSSLGAPTSLEETVTGCLHGMQWKMPPTTFFLFFF